MADPFDWRSLIPMGIGAGLNYLGQRSASGPSREQNAWQRQLVESEMRRRNMMQGYAAPSMLHALGMRDPGEIQRATSAISGPAPGAPSATPVPSAPGSKLGKGLGAAAGAAGLAGMAGIPFAGPVAAGLGAASALVSKVGQGRRTANQATGSGGFEQQFALALEKAATGQSSAAELQAARQAYEAQANAWVAAGGNQAKVAQQSLANRDLQETYQTLLRQLGSV